MIDRERLRARLHLGALLPVLPLVAPAGAARRLAGRAIDIAVDDALAAHVCADAGALVVRAGRHAAPSLRLSFADAPALNRFFAGRALPSLDGWHRPLLVIEAARLLASLRILDPRARSRTAAARAVRVRALLAFAVRALAELQRGGHPEMRALVDESPDRVYQWTVDDGAAAAFLRMCRGRVRAGRGEYARRRPFVHFRFPTVEAAYRVLTATGSQMEAVARGWVRTEGSPEYARKVSGLLQEAGALLDG